MAGFDFLTLEMTNALPAIPPPENGIFITRMAKQPKKKKKKKRHPSMHVGNSFPVPKAHLEPLLETYVPLHKVQRN